MWELLTTIRDRLRTIPEFKTVNIGVETGIVSDDTPAARIVTEYSETSKNKYFDNGSLQIIIFLDLKNDLPSVYEDSISLELKIREALKDVVEFTRIDYDRDFVTVFKVSIMWFNFSGIRNSRVECEYL